VTIPIRRTGEAAAAALAALTERYGELPSDYLHFLTMHDGAALPYNALRGNDDVSVRRFTPAAEIAATADGIEGLNEGLIPIAFDDCGNYICLGADDHKIYFWNHEDEVETKVIAEYFSDMLRKIELIDLSLIENMPKATSVWVDPAFKPSYYNSGDKDN